MATYVLILGAGAMPGTGTCWCPRCLSGASRAGGHLVALSQPKELAERLEAYLEGIGTGEDG